MYCVSSRRYEKETNQITTAYNMSNHQSMGKSIQTSSDEELKEKQRRGRKRKLSEETVGEIVNYTKKTKFTTPASIKFHFGLNVSKRTIDRRLIEHGLYGRVGKLCYSSCFVGNDCMHSLTLLCI
jgi:transposase